MKIQFLATGEAPDRYDIDGEKIVAYKNGKAEQIDLSPLEEDGQFHGIELENIEISPTSVIRDAKRENGRLKVTLCQQPPPSKLTFQLKGYD